jgi:hypothetical protein
MVPRHGTRAQEAGIAISHFLLMVCYVVFACYDSSKPTSEPGSLLASLVQTCLSHPASAAGAPWYNHWYLEPLVVLSIQSIKLSWIAVAGCQDAHTLQV